jgi:hypothetical protein
VLVNSATLEDFANPDSGMVNLGQMQHYPPHQTGTDPADAGASPARIAPDGVQRAGRVVVAP